jgi:hypothetical protein
MHLLRLVQRHPKSNEHRTVFDTFSSIYIHISEGVMRYVISFGIWAAPANFVRVQISRSQMAQRCARVDGMLGPSLSIYNSVTIIYCKHRNLYTILDTRIE